MAKIEPIGNKINWSPEAALHAALAEAGPDDRCLVILTDSKCGDQRYFCANSTRAEVIYMMELHKARMFDASEDQY